MDNPFSLFGKTILVTGASSGIGRTIAVACAQLDANVIATGRNEVRLQETLDLMVGVNHTMIVADLSDATQTENLVEQLPKLDGISHNAGISLRTTCNNIEVEDCHKIMTSNFEAPVLLQKYLLANKRINKNASIVFMASKAADYPAVGNALYSASKGALISYAKVLALELVSRNIRVNCICPAMVWTNLITADGSMSREQLLEAQLKYPLKRYGQPEDVAYLAVYLLSNASSWMTGTCIDLTGGKGTLI